MKVDESSDVTLCMVKDKGETYHRHTRRNLIKQVIAAFAHHKRSRDHTQIK